GRQEGNPVDPEDEAEGRREVHLARPGHPGQMEGAGGDFHLRRQGREIPKMTTMTPSATQRGILRYSPWDAVLVVLAAVHGVVLLAAPCLAVVALGLWWNSNTISHNFIHRPFFRSRLLNALFALYLSVLLGIPQSIWRDRHLAHHRGARWRLKPSPQLA